MLTEVEVIEHITENSGNVFQVLTNSPGQLKNHPFLFTVSLGWKPGNRSIQ